MSFWATGFLSDESMLELFQTLAKGHNQHWMLILCLNLPGLIGIDSIQHRSSQLQVSA